MVEKISEDDIDKLINELDEVGDMDNTDKYALKMLITGSSKDIAFKTELTTEQINAISKLLTIHSIVEAQSIFVSNPEKGRNLMKSVVPDMTEVIMRLVVSKNRRGRAEFVDAFKGSQKFGEESSGFRKFIGGGY